MLPASASPSLIRQGRTLVGSTIVCQVIVAVGCHVMGTAPGCASDVCVYACVCVYGSEESEPVYIIRTSYICVHRAMREGEGEGER